MAGQVTYFDPDTLAVLKGVLDDAWASLSPDIQARTSRSALAVFILKEAANGERDPAYLRASALADVADELLKSNSGHDKRKSTSKSYI
jgi:hypothetical protein